MIVLNIHVPVMNKEVCPSVVDITGKQTGLSHFNKEIIGDILLVGTQKSQCASDNHLTKRKPSHSELSQTLS